VPRYLVSRVHLCIIKVGSAYVLGRCVETAGSDPEFFQCERRMTMQLTDQQLMKLGWLRRDLLVAIAEGKGAEIAFRSKFLEFEEREATFLLDQMHFSGSRVAVYDLAHIDLHRASKWGSVHDSSVLEATIEAMGPTARGLFGKKLFRVLSFVRVQGKVKGGAKCEGMFCALSQIDSYCGEDTTLTTPCRGKELGRREGKVMLYPIECLVPVTPQINDQSYGIPRRAVAPPIAE